MASYYRDGGLSWKEYLQQNAFVKDVTNEIRRATRDANSGTKDQTKALTAAIDKDTTELRQLRQDQLRLHQDQARLLGDSNTLLIEQTKRLVASQEQTDDILIEGFADVGRGVDKVQTSLKDITSGIEGLRSEFEWAMSGVLHQLQVQQLLLRDIYTELGIPDFQKERRYYVQQACKHLQNGLYDEALRNFIKAEPLERADPFVLSSLGHIYLYQPAHLDVEKAYEYFVRAARYYEAEGQLAKAAENQLHAGMAAYLNRSSLAHSHAEKASVLAPTLLEALFCRAKFLAAAGDASGLGSLEQAIRSDRRYADRALGDNDFTLIACALNRLIARLLAEANETAIGQLAATRSRLADVIAVGTAGEAALMQLGKRVTQLSESVPAETYYAALGVAGEVQTIARQVDCLMRVSKIGPVSCDQFSCEGSLYAMSGLTRAGRLGTASGPRAAGGYSVRVWENVGGEARSQYEQVSQSVVQALALSDDGRRVAWAVEKAVFLGDTEGVERPVQLAGHDERVRGISFSPDGRLLASWAAHRDSACMEVIVWVVGEQRRLEMVKSGCRALVFPGRVAWGDESGLRLAYCDGFSVTVWMVGDGAGAVHSMQVESDGACERVLGVEWGEKAECVVGVTAGGTVVWWRARDMTVAATRRLGEFKETLASACGHNECRVFDVLLTKDCARAIVLARKYGHDEREGETSGCVSVWDTENGECLDTVALRGKEYCLGMDGAGTRLVLWGAEVEVRWLESTIVERGRYERVVAERSGRERLLEQREKGRRRLEEEKAAARREAQRVKEEKAEQERREEERVRREAQEAEDRRRRAEAEARQAAEWRQHGRCVVCGAELGFWRRAGFIYKCRKHD